MGKQLRKIVFVIGELSSGGAERVISVLSNYFSNNNIEVSIMLVSSDKIEYELDSKIKVIPICNRVKRKSGFSAMIQKIFQIRKYVKSANPDIVISFLTHINIYSCIAFLLSKHKLIISERNDPKNNLGNFVMIMRKIAYPMADGFVFQTEEAKSYFAKRIQKKSVIIPNPIKDNLPNPYSGVRNRNIVAVGRLEKQKNYPLLFEAFKEFSKTYDGYKLTVYGEGSERKHLEELIKSLNLENDVTLRGVVKNFHAEITAAKMYIMTSDFEGMPNALMEAMAIGLPCISTDCPCGGPSYLIRHMENGLLFKVRDKSTLVKYMKLLASDVTLSNKLAENAYFDSKKYSIEKIAEKWLTFVKTIL